MEIRAGISLTSVCQVEGWMVGMGGVYKLEGGVNLLP